MRCGAGGTCGRIRRGRRSPRWLLADEPMTALAERRDSAQTLGTKPGIETFRIVLAAFVLVGVAKVHEAIPKIGIIPWVKLAGVVLILNAGNMLRPETFRTMLRTPTARWVSVMLVLSV